MPYNLGPLISLQNTFVHVLTVKCPYLSGETRWGSYIRGEVLQK